MVAYTMKDVRKLGIEEVVRRAIEHVSPKCVKLFIIRLILTFSHDYSTSSFSLYTATILPFSFFFHHITHIDSYRQLYILMKVNYDDDDDDDDMLLQL